MTGVNDLYKKYKVVAKYTNQKDHPTHKYDPEKIEIYLNVLENEKIIPLDGDLPKHNVRLFTTESEHYIYKYEIWGKDKKRVYITIYEKPVI